MDTHAEETKSMRRRHYYYHRHNNKHHNHRRRHADQIEFRNLPNEQHHSIPRTHSFSSIVSKVMDSQELDATYMEKRDKIHYGNQPNATKTVQAKNHNDNEEQQQDQVDSRDRLTILKDFGQRPQLNNLASNQPKITSNLANQAYLRLPVSGNGAYYSNENKFQQSNNNIDLYVPPTNSTETLKAGAPKRIELNSIPTSTYISESNFIKDENVSSSNTNNNKYAQQQQHDVFKLSLYGSGFLFLIILAITIQNWFFKRTKRSILTSCGKKFSFRNRKRTSNSGESLNYSFSNSKFLPTCISNFIENLLVKFPSLNERKNSKFCETNVHIQHQQQQQQHTLIAQKNDDTNDGVIELDTIVVRGETNLAEEIISSPKIFHKSIGVTKRGASSVMAANIGKQPKVSNSKLTILRKGIANNSLVVAVKSSTKPKITLVQNRVSKFIDDEAYELRKGSENLNAYPSSTKSGAQKNRLAAFVLLIASQVTQSLVFSGKYSRKARNESNSNIDADIDVESGRHDFDQSRAEIITNSCCAAKKMLETIEEAPDREQAARETLSTEDGHDRDKQNTMKDNLKPVTCVQHLNNISRLTSSPLANCNKNIIGLDACNSVSACSLFSSQSPSMPLACHCLLSEQANNLGLHYMAANCKKIIESHLSPNQANFSYNQCNEIHNQRCNLSASTKSKSQGNSPCNNEVQFTDTSRSANNLNCFASNSYNSNCNNTACLVGGVSCCSTSPAEHQHGARYDAEQQQAIVRAQQAMSELQPLQPQPSYLKRNYENYYDDEQSDCYTNLTARLAAGIELGFDTMPRHQQLRHHDYTLQQPAISHRVVAQPDKQRHDHVCVDLPGPQACDMSPKNANLPLLCQNCMSNNNDMNSQQTPMSILVQQPSVASRSASPALATNPILSQAQCQGHSPTSVSRCSSPSRSNFLLADSIEPANCEQQKFCSDLVPDQSDMATMTTMMMMMMQQQQEQQQQHERHQQQLHPRRTSIAGDRICSRMAQSGVLGSSSGLTHNHFLHRASIASADGSQWLHTNCGQQLARSLGDHLSPPSMSLMMMQQRHQHNLLHPDSAPLTGPSHDLRQHHSHQQQQYQNYQPHVFQSQSQARDVNGYTRRMQQQQQHPLQYASGLPYQNHFNALESNRCGYYVCRASECSSLASSSLYDPNSSSLYCPSNAGSASCSGSGSGAAVAGKSTCGSSGGSSSGLGITTSAWTNAPCGASYRTTSSQFANSHNYMSSVPMDPATEKNLNSSPNASQHQHHQQQSLANFCTQQHMGNHGCQADAIKSAIPSSQTPCFGATNYAFEDVVVSSGGFFSDGQQQQQQQYQQREQTVSSCLLTSNENVKRQFDFLPPNCSNLSGVNKNRNANANGILCCQSRKFSLPIQLEYGTTIGSNLRAAELEKEQAFGLRQIVTERQKLKQTDIDGQESARSKPLQGTNTKEQQDICDSRKSSQTITRQSSFWLDEDDIVNNDLGSDDSIEFGAEFTNKPSSSGELGDNPNNYTTAECSNQMEKHDASQDEEPENDAKLDRQPTLDSREPNEPGRSSSASQPKHREPKAESESSSPSSSSSSSPSPDFGRANERVSRSTATPKSSPISRRHQFGRSSRWRKMQKYARNSVPSTSTPLGFLDPCTSAATVMAKLAIESHATPSESRDAEQVEKQSIAPNANANSYPATKKQSQVESDMQQVGETRIVTSQDPLAPVPSSEGNSCEQDDSEADILNAHPERTIPDLNSASLERQCRDLWKLRATLHDNSCAEDDWTSYHQRLNRRYDSGYKSIEDQVSHSIETAAAAAAVAVAVSVAISSRQNSDDQQEQQQQQLQRQSLSTSSDQSVKPDLVALSSTPANSRPPSGCSGYINPRQVCDQDPEFDPDCRDRLSRELSTNPIGDVFDGNSLDNDISKEE